MSTPISSLPGTVVFEGEREVLIKRRSHWAKESQVNE
jgi:hypothetical protein